MLDYSGHVLSTKRTERRVNCSWMELLSYVTSNYQVQILCAVSVNTIPRSLVVSDNAHLCQEFTPILKLLRSSYTRSSYYVLTLDPNCLHYQGPFLGLLRNLSCYQL
jgi:hypothetical protein